MASAGLMGALGPIGAVGGILTGIFGTGSSTSGSQKTQYGQTPTYDPTAENLRQTIINASIGNLSKDPNLAGYQSQGLETINQGYDSAQKALQQTLAARGLSYSPIAASSTAALDTSRIGAGIQFQNQLPLLQQQLFQQRLAQALQTFAAQPYSISGFQNQQYQQKSQSGGLLSGLF